MRILVTGADGFVGQHLVRTLRAGPLDRLVLVDRQMSPVADERVATLSGDIADAALREAAFAGGIDGVFHLAAVPGGMAERDPALSRRVNRDATLALARLAAKAGARFVNAGTIAVLGRPGAAVDDATPPRPDMVYGRHKREAEAAVAELARTDGLRASTIRLPGIVARPPVEAGLKSAFLSDIFHAVRTRRPFLCPVSPDATMWLMSVRVCVANLLHAARPETIAALGGEAVTLPAQRVGMADLVAALATACAANPALVAYAPDEGVEAAFGRLPSLVTDRADRAGFRHDGSLAALVRAALDDCTSREQRDAA